MRCFATALLLALLVHVAFLALVGGLLSPAAHPSVLPAPDLPVTTVELSLAACADAEGVVGAPATVQAAPAPTPPVVQHLPEPMPDFPLRDEGVIPTIPEIRVTEHSLEPPLPEASSAEPSPVAETPPTANATRETARVVVPPRPCATFRPVYPRGSRARREEGTVTLEIEVSACGVAAGVRVDDSSGFPELDAAAVAAARQAVFVPASRDGKSVVGTVRLPISFHLRSVSP